MTSAASGSDLERIRIPPLPNIEEVLQELEAPAEKEVELCLENAKQLTAEPSLDLLMDFCSATRMAWARVYRLHVCCREECPQDLLKDFLFAIQLGMVGANDVPSRERSQGNVVQCEKAKTYLDNISVRRGLVSILASRGPDAVKRRLAQLKAEVDPSHQLPETRQEPILAPARLRRKANVAEYRAILMAKAFWGLTCALRSLNLELVREIGPFARAVRDHAKIAAQSSDRANWFIKLIESVSVPEQQRREQARFQAALADVCARLANEVLEPLEDADRKAQEEGPKDPELESFAESEIRKARSASSDLALAAEKLWRELAETLPEDLRQHAFMSIRTLQELISPAEQVPDARFCPSRRLLVLIEEGLIRPPPHLLEGLQERAKSLGEPMPGADPEEFAEMIIHQVEGLCASLARRAAALGEHAVRLSCGGRFTDEVAVELVEQLEVTPYRASDALTLLHREMLAFASAIARRRLWGSITSDGSDIMLDVDIEKALEVPNLDSFGPESCDVGHEGRAVAPQPESSSGQQTPRGESQGIGTA